MTRDERRESIRRLVDAAPLLPPEDIDRLRSLMPGLRQALTAPSAPPAPQSLQPTAA